MDQCQRSSIGRGLCPTHYQRWQRTGDPLGTKNDWTSVVALDIPDTQAAYLAGLIDGEGYIGISIARGNKAAQGSRGGESHRLCVTVRMTDRAPLEIAASWTGLGKVNVKKQQSERHRVPYEWIVWSRQAASVLLAIRPYLIVKAPQADLGIEFQRMMRLPGRQGLTDFEWSERRRLAAAIRSHNYGKENVS